MTGGTCVNFGCTPSKALIRCARAVHDAGRGAEFGFRLDGPPRPDFGAVMERVRRMRSPSSAGDAVQVVEQTGAHVYLGHTRFTAPNIVEVDDRQLRFWKAVIASGSGPFVPSIILAEKGTIDRYLGDGIMAFWRGPGACRYGTGLATQRRVGDICWSLGRKPRTQSYLCVQSRPVRGQQADGASIQPGVSSAAGFSNGSRISLVMAAGSPAFSRKESQVRNRLAGGGSRIRTIGPSRATGIRAPELCAQGQPRRVRILKCSGGAAILTIEWLDGDHRHAGALYRALRTASEPVWSHAVDHPDDHPGFGRKTHAHMLRNAGWEGTWFDTYSGRAANRWLLVMRSGWDLRLPAVVPELLKAADPQARRVPSCHSRPPGRAGRRYRRNCAGRA
jgi:hypothetical protein